MIHESLVTLLKVRQAYDHVRLARAAEKPTASALPEKLVSRVHETTEKLNRKTGSREG
jgi:hypothetical protein